MPEILMVRLGDALRPANDPDLEALRKLKHGQMVRVKFTIPRNEKFMRKAFALMRLAFQYWEPDSTVAKVERDTVIHMGKFMVRHGMDAATAKSFCQQFLLDLKAKRQALDVDKAFTPFRHWLTIAAGFYETVQTPVGPKKIPLSIGYASMTEETFGQFYKAIFSVCWTEVLHRTFKSEQEAENAVAQLMEFD